MSSRRAQKKRRRRTNAERAAAAGETTPGGGRTSPAKAARAAQATPRPAQQDRAARPASRFELRDGVARPQPIWAPFALTEIGMAAGIAIFVAGMLTEGSRATWLLTVAVLLLVVVVGELCLREHFGGFRSHTLLLAVLPVAILNGVAVLVFGDAVRGPPVLLLDVALAGGLAWLLNRLFRAAHEGAAARAAEV